MRTGGAEAVPDVRVALDPTYQCAVLYVVGPLDELHTPRFRQVLYDVLGLGYRDIILHLGETTCVSSVGIGAWICGLRRLGSERGRIVLVSCRPTLERILSMSGVLRLFPLYESEGAAREALFRVVTRIIEPSRENCASLRSWLQNTTSELGLTALEQATVEAAASEAFSNAVEHAASKTNPVTVRVVMGSSLVVEIQDHGPGFEARQYFAADPGSLGSSPGGVGIHVMRHLMDQVEFTTGPSSSGGTTVRLVKRLQDPHPRSRSA